MKTRYAILVSLLTFLVRRSTHKAAREESQRPLDILSISDSFHRTVGLNPASFNSQSSSAPTRHPPTPPLLGEYIFQ